MITSVWYNKNICLWPSSWHPLCGQNSGIQMRTTFVIFPATDGEMIAPNRKIKIRLLPPTIKNRKVAPWSFNASKSKLHHVLTDTRRGAWLFSRKFSTENEIQFGDITIAPNLNYSCYLFTVEKIVLLADFDIKQPNYMCLFWNQFSLTQTHWNCQVWP